MPRTVNEEAHAARRNAILDAAQRAIATKGYEQMAISDLLSELGISSGAFYHYFDSKPTLLYALVQRTGNMAQQRVEPILQDGSLSAIEKLRQIFRKFDEEKLANKSLVLAYVRVWYADDNAIVRQKLYTNRIKWFVPMLEQIIRQGIAEGTMNTPYPELAGRMMLALLEDLGASMIDLLIAKEHSEDDFSQMLRLITAAIDAHERLLGAPPGSLQYWKPEDVEKWMSSSSSSKDEEQAQPQLTS